MLLAVDTNVLLDQALENADVLDALEVIRERLDDARFIVTSTVLEELARLVASQAPLTLRATKEALRRLRMASVPEGDRDLILMCYMSADFREGMDAFLNKRAPVWAGK